MDYVYSIMWTLGGLGVLLLGMKIMSECLQRTVGVGVRKVFNKMNKNPLMGVGIGAAVTGVIQSSSASTVMVLGFVNAGLMNLYQATTIIMGANIGTCVTGLIIGLSAFDIAPFFAAIAFVGAFMDMLSKNDKVKSTGMILAGLGIIFVGLEVMSDALGIFTEGPGLMNFFLSMSEMPIVLLLLGMIFTALIHSSSAVTGIVITMAGTGAMPMGASLFLILGANIGTCVTALIASFGGSQNTKRAALIHILFNVLGTVFFYPFVRIWGNQISEFLLLMAGGLPQMAIAFFHLFFNVLSTAFILPFAKLMVSLVEKIIPNKKNAAHSCLEFLDERFLSTPSFAVEQLKKEVLSMAEKARRNVNAAFDDVMNVDLKNAKEIESEEEKLDFLNREIGYYLVELSASQLSHGDEKDLGSMHHTISDIERIGDHAINLLDSAKAMVSTELSFTDKAKAELSSMFGEVMKMYPLAIKTFETHSTELLKEVSEIENGIDRMKEEFSANHIARLNAGKCTVDSGAIFFNTLADLERIADHLNNISFSILPHRIESRMEKIKEAEVQL